MKRKIAISMGQTFLDKRNETRDFIDVRDVVEAIFLILNLKFYQYCIQYFEQFF